MKLFLLETDQYDYDEYDGFVVRASSEKQAREIVKNELTDIIRQDIDMFNCIEINARGEAEVILASFHAG